MTKWCSILAVAVFVVLGWAAVTMGGLNQDEGWYLYAANLIAEGKLPYRDFFFTQGPVMPIVYSAFTGIWNGWGLAGARAFTLSIGAFGIVFAMALARRMTTPDRRNEVSAIVFLLLGCNLYHLYYLTIPKTYALAALFVLVGFYLLSFTLSRLSWLFCLGAGLCLAFAAGTRISLGFLLPVAGIWLLVRRRWIAFAWFCLGGCAGLLLVYLPFLVDNRACEGLFAAQRYHAMRGGFDITWVVGSFSRLVRWYLPVFVAAGLGCFRKAWVLFAGFLVVFAVQMLAPFPYEDYQVPVMALLAVFAAVNLVAIATGKMPVAPGTGFATGETPVAPEDNRTVEKSKILLLVLGMCFACSFGSPLLEKWSTNGQDRFWSLKKEKYELRQLQDVAREIEALDPGGKDLLTQDLYLAIETGRKVPEGLEMGPFAMLSERDWEQLLDSAPCRMAALSAYSFAVNPPVCDERPLDKQMKFWNIVMRHYNLEIKEDNFGQNATPLLVLKRK